MPQNSNEATSRQIENPIDTLLKVRPNFCVHPGLVGPISVALLLAYGDMPYSYYEVLRIAVCIFGGIAAYQHFKSGRQVLGALAATIALLYNPLAPVHLSRDSWEAVNAATLISCWLLAIEAPMRVLKQLGGWLIQPKTLKVIGALLLVTALVFGLLYFKKLQEEEAYRIREEQRLAVVAQQRAEEAERFRVSRTPFDEPNIVQSAIASATPSLNWGYGGTWTARTPVPLADYAAMVNVSNQFIAKTVARVRLPNAPTGLPRELFVQASVPNSSTYSCHVCGAILSIYVLRAESGKVVVEASAPFFGTAGHWGAFPEQENLEALALGKDGLLIALRDGDMGQGNTSSWVSLVGLLGKEITYLGALELDEDNAGNCAADTEPKPCVNVKGSYELVDGPGPYKDILLSRVTTTDGKKTNTSVKRYRLATSPKFEFREVSVRR